MSKTVIFSAQEIAVLFDTFTESKESGKLMPVEVQNKFLEIVHLIRQKLEPLKDQILREQTKFERM